MFKRYLRDFASPGNPTVFSSAVGAGQGHAFYNPLAKQGVCQHNEFAGRYMVDVYKQYVEIVDLLSVWAFECRIDGRIVRVSFRDAEIAQLRSWCCFATNACMLERMWGNYFNALP